MILRVLTNGQAPRPGSRTEKQHFHPATIFIRKMVYPRIITSNAQAKLLTNTHKNNNL